MINQISNKTITAIGSVFLVSGMSITAQAGEVNADIMASFEKSMSQQTAKLIEVAKKEVMLSFEAQLAEMVNELSAQAGAVEKNTDVQVAQAEQQEQIDSDIEQ